VVKSKKFSFAIYDEVSDRFFSNSKSLSHCIFFVLLKRHIQIILSF